MALWETDVESSSPVNAMVSLPAPTDTPYRTPSRASRSSRKSRRSTNRSVTPPGKSSSPPPLPTEKGSKRSSRDIAQDATISILDPRRFTPTLHANLVSEILNLRRDQEEKTKIIEGLESTLHETRGEAEELQSSLASAGKENRSLKRQLTLLEGGTSSALGELVRERDEAINTTVDTKRRLEAAQKRLKSQEEDSERVHIQWAKEKEMWDEEKRKFELKVHIAETRLKALLDEVAAYQVAHVDGAADAPESEVEEPTAKENDAGSIRTMSITNSIRFSTLTAAAKVNGHSLADELNLEGDDSETDYGGRESALSSHYHMRNNSRDSMFTMTHRRNMSNGSPIRRGSVARGRMGLHHSTLERLEGNVIREDEETAAPAAQVSYTDTAVQYSPPPSPKANATKPSTPEPPMIRLDMSGSMDSPSEANQRRKRVSLVRPLTVDLPNATSHVVNGPSQTVGEPLSPPRTPQTPFEERRTTLEPEASAVMVSAATQTDILPPLQAPMLQSPSHSEPIPIPTISIVPPSSRPSTPREPRLPQLTQDFGCQVSILQTAPMASVAVQTEEIRVDKRRIEMLPPHLRPSAIVSRPVSPAPSIQEATLHDPRQFTPVPGNLPPRNPRRLTSKTSLTKLTPSTPAPSGTEGRRDAYPGNNDNGPLSSQAASIRRPHRISSLFAGFDRGSSDEVDEFGDVDLSDAEFRTALTAPRPQVVIRKVSKRMSGSKTTTMSPEPVHPSRVSIYGGLVRPMGSEAYSSVSLPNSKNRRDSGGSNRPQSKATSRSSVATSNKTSGIRRAAMIQNGIASHQRARSPSLPGLEEPPFPIPARASSRKPPVSASAPSDGRTSASPTRGAEPWHKRTGRHHYRAGSIRKVRSAAALPGRTRYRRHGSRSRSPPTFSPSTGISETSEQLPPLPSYEVTTSQHRETYAKQKGYHRHQPSTTTAHTAETGQQSVGSSNQSTSVVDAIAQTMVGEWMFKYVRRRKSFGVGDTKGGDDSSNDRHKRWVWLAPYERAILWSSKQPTSGSALLGKAGRKLPIQSVLDVKDDNPPPKGTGPLFNRSILILTPQRALKFTSTSAERHYVWLTALSFLAHSQQAIPEIALPVVAPSKPTPEQYAIPAAKVRKPGIRDSIRLAKGKTNTIFPRTTSVAASSQTDSVPPSIPSYIERIIPEEFPALMHHQRDYSRDVAEPPHIPRYHERANQVTLHGRKRSNTGGHVPPPLSFRGFSGPTGSGSHHASTNSTSVHSTGTAGSSDVYNYSQAGSSGHMAWGPSSVGGSVRTSEASSRPSAPNFFESIPGTVRMDAFISPLAFNQLDEHDELRYVARKRSKELRRRASRSRTRHRDRDSYTSKSTRTTADDVGVEDWYASNDPFRGF